MIGDRGAGTSAKGPAVAVPIAVGWLFLFLAAPATGAATVHGGTATLARPGATAAGALASGGSPTPFTVVLPAQASCSGDTAHRGYHVYSYLVPRGTDLSTVTFVDVPSKGYGLVNSSGTYYGAVNTALGTGQIIGIPNDFVWGKLLRSDGGAVALPTLVDGPSHGQWEAGIACANSHGRLVDRWNTQVTFNAGGGARGFTWHAVPGGTTGSSSPAATGAVVGATSSRVASSVATVTVHGASDPGAGSTAVHGSPTTGAGGAVHPAGGSGPDSPTAVADVSVAAAASAGAIALAAGALLLVRRGRRAHPTPATPGSRR